MINIKEVRVGNLVDLYGSIATIQIADFKGIGSAISSGKPIPLTEERLIKFGFEKQSDLIKNITCLEEGGDNGFNNSIEFMNDKYEKVFLYKGEYYYIIDENGDDYGTNYTSKKLEYVHQFQNLHYSLTGIELISK